jgi:hypothetical protein
MSKLFYFKCPSKILDSLNDSHVSLILRRAGSEVPPHENTGRLFPELLELGGHAVPTAPAPLPSPQGVTEHDVPSEVDSPFTSIFDSGHFFMGIPRASGIIWAARKGTRNLGVGPDPDLVMLIMTTHSPGHVPANQTTRLSVQLGFFLYRHL